MLQLETTEYERKPFKVRVAEVTAENIELIARWTGGTVRTDDEGQHVKIKVHRPATPRQAQAYVKDLVLMSSNGFKVYTPEAFAKSFRMVSDKRTPVTFPDELIAVVEQPRKAARKPRPKPGPAKAKAQ